MTQYQHGPNLECKNKLCIKRASLLCIRFAQTVVQWAHLEKGEHWYSSI